MAGENKGDEGEKNLKLRISLGAHIQKLCTPKISFLGLLINQS